MKKYFLSIIFLFGLFAGNAQCPVTPVNRTACNGVAFSFTAASLGFAPATTFTWTAPVVSGVAPGVANPAPSATINGTLTLTGAVAGTATYTVTPSCVAATFTLTITVNPIPAAPGVSIASVNACLGATLTIDIGDVTGATGYFWDRPNALTDTTTVASVLVRANATAALSGAYTARAIVNACTSAVSTTITATVNPVPSAPTVTTPISICQGSILTIDVGDVPGATYLWDRPAPLPDTVTAISVLVRANAQLNAAGVYTVRAIASACTSAVSSPITANINPVPSAPTVTSPISICQGSTLTINVGDVTGATYFWDRPAPLADTVTAVSVLVRANAQSNAAGVYTVRAIASACTSAVSSPITANINAIPSAPTVTTPISICQGNTLTIDVSDVAGATYLWDRPAPLSDTVTSLSVLVRANAQLNAAGAYTVRAIANACTSAVSSTINVNITAIPSAPSVPNPTIAVCQGLQLTIDVADASGATSYLWDRPGALADTSTSVSQLVRNNAQSNSAGNYTVRAIAAACTSGVSATISVTVRATPTLSGISTAVTCAGSGSVISLTGLVPAQSFTVSYTINGGGVITAPVSTDGSGNGSFTAPTTVTNNQSLVITSLSYSTPPTCPQGTLTNNQVTLQVRPTPTLTSVSPQTPICQGSTSAVQLSGLIQNTTFIINYTLTGQAATNVTVTSSASGTATFTSNAITTNGVVTLTINTISYSTAPACPSNPGVFAAITVGSGPSITSIVTSSVCQGTTAISATFNGSNLAGASFSISWNGTPPAPLANPTPGTIVGNSAAFTIAANTTPGNYLINSITVTSNSAPICSSTFTPTAGNNIILIVKPNPVITTNAGGAVTNQDLCPGEAILQLPVQVTLGGVGYTGPLDAGSGWTLNPNLNVGFGLSAQLTSANNILIPTSVTNAGNTVIPNTVLSVTVVVNGCPSTNASIANYTVNARPSFTLTGGLQEACAGSNTDLPICIQNNGSPAGTSFSYLYPAPAIGIPTNAAVSGTSLCITQFPVIHAGDADRVVQIVFTGTSPNGCTFQQTGQMTVKPLPSVEGSFTPKTLCSGENFSITPLAYNIADISTITGGVWKFVDANNNDVIGSTSFVVTSSSINFSFQNNGTANITGTVKVQLFRDGCTGPFHDVVQITVRPKPTISSVDFPGGITRCNDNELSAEFNCFPSDAVIVIEQFSGPGIGFNDSPDTVNCGDPFSFLAFNETDVSISGEFRATPKLQCAFGLQSGNVTPPWTFQVDPGPSINKQRLVNGTFINFSEDTLFTCSGVPIETLRFASGNTNQNLNWTFQFFPDPGLSGVPSTSPQSEPNLPSITIPSFTPSHSSNSVRFITLTVDGVSTDTLLPCEISFSKVFAVRPTPVLVSTATVKACHGVGTTIQLFSNNPQANIFDWTNDATGSEDIGLPASGFGSVINFPSPFNPNSETDPRTGLISVISTLPAIEVDGVIIAPACLSNPETFNIEVYAAPAIPTVLENLPEPICLNSTNLMLSLAPPINSSPTYTYDWQIGTLAVESFDATGLFGVFNFPTAGDGSIEVVRISDLSQCKSSALVVDFSVVGQDATDLTSTEIFLTSNGNGLICMNTDIDSYQWGMFSCEDFTNTIFAENGTFQTYFADNLSEQIQNNVFWVEITNNGCSSIIFYEQGCYGTLPPPVGIQPVKESITKSRLVAYPNPTNGLFRLESMSDLPGSTLISVYSIDGKLVKQVNILNLNKNTPIEFSLSDQADGLYLLNYFNEKGVEGKIRLIKSSPGN